MSLKTYFKKIKKNIHKTKIKKTNTKT